MFGQSVKVKFRPMPAESRFGVQSWVINQEDCYTEEELQLRAALLNYREHSGLDDQVLLQTSNSWFSNEFEQAFITVNAASWVLKPGYKPRQEISRNDFHIPLISSQLLKWRRLGTMTRLIGDYLLTRNDLLIDAHLNQPMNHMLLDLAQIIKRLAMQDNADYVANQLQLLSSYLRKIEILLSPFKGSDRLFLAESRRTIEDVLQKDIEQQLQTQQLKTRVLQIRMHLNRIAELRHTVLHFALTANPVNPHPYWELFVNPTTEHSHSAFPTLLAQSCLKKNDVLTSESVLPQSINAADLRHCPGFEFVENLSEAVQSDYLQGLNDLQETLHFQALLQQLLTLFDQAGELFTVFEFREQIHNFLEHIDQFMTRSQQTIVSIFNSNTQIYHQYIQEKQDLDASWTLNILNNKAKKLNHFITNQDNLARFITSTQDLYLANKALSLQLSQTQTNLNEATADQQQELADSTKELIQQLKIGMKGWVSKNKALPLDNPAKKIRKPPVNQLKALPIFWPQSSREPARMKALNASLQPTVANSDHLLLGLVVALPLLVLFVYLLYSLLQPSRKAVSTLSQQETEQLAIKVADQFSSAKHLVSESDNDELQETLEDYEDEAKQLIKRFHQGQSVGEKLQKLSEELEGFLDELQSSPLLMLSP